MLAQRLPLFALAMGITFCTDQNIPKDSGIQPQSKVPVSSTQIQTAESRTDLSTRDELPRGTLGADSSLSLLAATVEGQVVCDTQAAACGPALTIRLPMQEFFQEGSGGPLEPMELRAILEFYQSNDCLRSFVSNAPDIRNTFVSGCNEVLQGVAPVADGGTIFLSQGEYYVRIRGHDGAPYTHQTWVQRDALEPKVLTIRSLDLQTIPEDVAASR